MGLVVSGGGKVSEPYTSNSDRPILSPVALVMVNLTQVMFLAGKLMLKAVPLLGKEPTLTELPSLKVNVPAMMWSFKFGLSYKII